MYCLLEKTKNKWKRGRGCPILNVKVLKDILMDPPTLETRCQCHQEILEWHWWNNALGCCKSCDKFEPIIVLYLSTAKLYCSENLFMSSTASRLSSSCSRYIAAGCCFMDNGRSKKCLEEILGLSFQLQFSGNRNW